MRNFVFFMAFFGLTGTLLTLLQAHHLATLAASIGLGAVAAYAVQRLMDYLRASQSGALPGASALAGAEARVVVNRKTGAIVIGGGFGSSAHAAGFRFNRSDEYLPPGSSAIVAVVDDVYLDRLASTIGKADKRVSKAIDSGDYDKVKKAVEKSADQITDSFES